MNKRIVIKIGSGSLLAGYAATVQIGEEGSPPQVEIPARLPSAADIPALYQQWQQAYWQLGLSYRLEAQGGVTNVSDVSDIAQCRVMSAQLRDRLSSWLNGEDFRPIREKILEQLSPKDTARVLLQTQDLLLQRLPWYDLHIFQRYRNAEVGICLPYYQRVNYQGSRSAKVRVLAVLGESTGLDTQIDCTLLAQLPDADVHFLHAPSVEGFNQRLWDEQGWDILFFAGHSKSRVNCVANSKEASGEIQLNATETLTIPQLKHALSKAIDRGLNTAIFNSCDGLGLAADLADLYIPQVLVMREPVPDKVAHAFLQNFLSSFSAGTPFYLAVREAREKLQGLEARFPCATWLPVIVQNLAETPPTWRSLQGKGDRRQINRPHTVKSVDLPLPKRGGWKVAVATGLACAAAVLCGRTLGALESLELKAYDYFLRSRPTEPIDDRLLIITNTATDIAARPTGDNRSLSDETLSELLTRLDALNPQLIGLDVYRDGAAHSSKLAQQMAETDNLITICKAADHTVEVPAISRPAEVTNLERVGASDFVTDAGDDVVRRHLLAFSPPVDSDCQAGTAMSTLIALRYLKEAHDIPEGKADYIGQARLPFLRHASFGGYRNTADVSGTQILLNYRMLHNPSETGCGGVEETPADCISVGRFLSMSLLDLRSRFENKVVLIGTTDNSYGDPWRTPYTQVASFDRQVPGVFLQAQMISQLVSAALGERSLIGSWAEWQEGVWIAVWVLLGGGVGLSVGLKKFGLRVLLAEGVLLAVCWLLLVKGSVWVPWVPSAIALPTAAIATKGLVKSRSKSRATSGVNAL